MSRKKGYGIEKVDSLINSDDILGKEVIDSEGTFIGIAERILIDKVDLDIKGVSIDKGFLKKGLIIGKGYIDKITPYAIFLKIRPAYKIKGMTVFDSDGKKIGVISDVNLYGSKNSVKSVLVRSGLFRSRIEIPSSMIKRISENVFLNDRKEDIDFTKLKV